MISPWTFRCGSYLDVPPHVAGLTKLHLSINSQAPDVLTFQSTQPSALAADIFDFDDEFTLKRDGVTVFRGRIAVLPRHGDPGDESSSWQVLGPWHDLEQIVYHQTWLKRTEDSPDDDVEQLLSHVILGQDTTDVLARLTTAEELTNILTFAVDHDADITPGDLPTGLNMPWEECTDITCAEAIKRLLRWHPQAVTWFDYTTATPTLHIRDRSDLTAISLDLTAGALVRDWDITPRHDLVPAGVIVTFERTDLLTGDGGMVEARVTTEQVAPEGVERGDRRVLCFTVNLQGQRGSVQRQELGTRTFPEDLNDKDFWQEHLPALKQLNQADFTIVNAERLYTGDFPDVGDPALNEEVLIGQVPDWYSDKHVGNETIHADLLVLGKDDAGAVVLKQKKVISFHCVATDIEGEIRERDGLGAPPAGRDGIPRDCGEFFEHVTLDDYPEPEPEDLADELYARLSTLHYQGSVVLQYDEITSTAHMGKVLNLTNGRPAWATMNALIQQVAYDLDAGVVTLQFGPPSHLSISDIVALQRTNRVRHVPPPGEHRSRPNRGGPIWEVVDPDQKQAAVDQVLNELRAAILKSYTGDFGDETVQNEIELDPALLSTLHKVLTITDAGDGKYKAEFNWTRAHD